MQRRVFLELAGVGVAAALLPRLWNSPTPTANTAGWSICQVRPFMPRRDVEALLGTPDYHGPLAVANNQPGTYVEYGHRECTWNGNPTIVYDAQGKIISVVGPTALRDGVAQFALGDTEPHVIERLGIQPQREVYGGQTSDIVVTAQGEFHLTFLSGCLTRMIFVRPSKT